MVQLSGVCRVGARPLGLISDSQEGADALADHIQGPYGPLVSQPRLLQEPDKGLTVLEGPCTDPGKGILEDSRL